MGESSHGLGHLVFSLTSKLGAAYLLCLVIVFFTQRGLMYYPEPTPFRPADLGIEVLSLVELQNENGDLIRHWYAPPADPRKPALVYFQGNAGDLGNRAHKYAPWLDKGYGLFLIGYRGYGNPGKPTEDGLYADARQALFHLLDRVDKPETIVLYGESLGTGLATQMALEFPIRGLILEAPFTSYPDVGAYHYPYLPVRWLALDRYDTISKIKAVKAPVLVIHGEADKTVPFEQGKTVFQAAPEPKTGFFPKPAGHGNLYDYGAGEAVEHFLSDL